MTDVKPDLAYWLLSDEEPAVRWRATAPTAELATNLLAWNTQKEQRMSMNGGLVFNDSGYMEHGEGDEPQSNDVVFVGEMPMPTTREVREHYQNVRPGNGEPVGPAVDGGLSVHQLPDGDYGELPMPAVDRGDD